ncbi:uncharacterized protein SOCE26_040490 [Sorangium cellulosum]|uniref:Uncharacterized protein n=1 Tax=Sorangium cellulosum TaxID=56 RepID=A0A2L0ETI7_SORCE|nr:hypothetical protein [Sorangium cellulosum]AUX42616.1 uncharacterized protein SOCE26_040490 [Sorangium cellulosum]
MRTHSKIHRGALVSGAAVAISTIALDTPPAHAFAGVSMSSGCADLDDTPERLVKHRPGQPITYFITNGYKLRYPDAFSQYLVEDVTQLWERYMSGAYQWSDDITGRYSYYREYQDVYELKSVLLHEVGHALGMQHSDACYYNTNAATNQPWHSNYRAQGFNAVVTPTVGPELMNEGWAYSSPGAKVPTGTLHGYNRTPGVDDRAFALFVYPFMSMSFAKQNHSGTIRFDSTNSQPSGGQTRINAVTAIDSDDLDEGWWIDRVNVWVGGSIGLKQKRADWTITNDTGHDINQVTITTSGSSTKRAIDESGPGEFISFGLGDTSSPETQIASWSASFDDRWKDGSTDHFSLTLDVHDWKVDDAHMWASSNHAFPIPLPDITPFGPGALTTPSSPPWAELPFDSGLPEPPDAPRPDTLEMLQPPVVAPSPGVRGFVLSVGAAPAARVESVHVVAVDWAEGELLARSAHAVRQQELRRRLSGDQALDLTAQLSGSSGGHARTRVTVPVTMDKTYAVRVITRSDHASVELLMMPEATRYQGGNEARCNEYGLARNCCPEGTVIAHGGDGDDGLVPDPESNVCILAGGGKDELYLPRGRAQVASGGDGDDRILTAAPHSIVYAGTGDDTVMADAGAALKALGGSGADVLMGETGKDHLDGGNGADELIGGAGADVLLGGRGDDVMEGDAGDDRLYPGSGQDMVQGGEGADTIVILDPCEVDAVKLVDGGAGNDVLVLPVSLHEAEARGLVVRNVEIVREYASRASLFAQCDDPTP